jgi:hypothetical protein
MFATIRREMCRMAVVGLLLLASQGVSPAQLLVSDNFDVGNTNGGLPGIGWALTHETGIVISVVNSNVTMPDSPPYCVQLIGNNGTQAARISQNFPTTSSGIAYASFKVLTLKDAPCSIQLQTTDSVFLCALVFDTNGLMGYVNTGTNVGTTAVDTAVHWTTGTWQQVQIEWFGNDTFNGYCGTTQIVQGLSFATNATPGQLALAAGSTSSDGQTGYVDNALAVTTEAWWSDDFDTNETVGLPPVGWVVSTPTNTSIEVVDSADPPPLSSPSCVQFYDNTTTSSPQMDTNFPAVAQGRYFYSTWLSSTNQGPFDAHLRTTNGTFLTAIRLGNDGKIAYNNTAGGSGPFTESSVYWSTSVWETVQVEWFSNNTFSAYCGSNQIVANAAFGTNLNPGEVLFRLTDATITNRSAFLDNVWVEEPVNPGPAARTNNGVWLGYSYTDTQSYINETTEDAFQMATNYAVPYWFLDVGTLGTNGVLEQSVNVVTNFLDRLGTWETQQGHQFKVLAYISGALPYSGGPTSGNVNVSLASVASNIVLEAEKFVSTNVAGSYITNASRAFDGVQLDLEPSGSNGSDTQYDNIVQIMVNIKSAFRSLGLGNKLVSFTAPPYTTTSTNNNIWYWPPMYYYNMGTNLGILCSMTYDTGYTNGPQYQSWIQDQTTNVLKMVSGRYWNNDSLHPAPTNGVGVMIGFPAYPNSSIHTNTAENIYYAAPGVSAGLTSLKTAGDLSTNYFLGGSIFELTNGSGQDGYAGYDTDMWWFGHDWLDAW